MQVTNLFSMEEATIWAQDALAIKNQLTMADAQLVEEAFASRMMVLGKADKDDHEGSAPAAGVIADPVTTEPPTILAPAETVGVGEPEPIERSKLIRAAPPRRRDKAHLKYVAAQACLVCGRQPSDPHHLRFAQGVALGRKVSDEFTVPLCRGHHRELHRSNGERKWWDRLGIDPMTAAIRLWKETHGASHLVKSAAPIDKPTSDRKRCANGKVARGTGTQSGTTMWSNFDDLAKAD